MDDRDSYFAFLASHGQLPDCNMPELQQNLNSSRAEVDQYRAERTRHLDELREQDDEISSLKDEVAVLKRQIKSLSNPTVTQRGQGSDGSKNSQARGKKTQTSTPPLASSSATTSLPPLLPCTSATTSLPINQPHPATGMLPPPLPMSRAPIAAPKPSRLKGKGKETAKGIDRGWSESPPHSKAEAKRRCNWYRPNAEITDDESDEDPGSHLNCLDRERAKAVLLQAGLAASRDHGNVINTSGVGSSNSLAARITAGPSNAGMSSFPRIDDDEQVFIDDAPPAYAPASGSNPQFPGPPPPGWRVNEHGNIYYRYEDDEQDTLVITLGGMVLRYV
ncbi:hypothetical protein BJ138DRAFT_1118833 [Hygrophoropsis aurantiaca]|uniref:Uncharacterized protein n=1 Tax=Hygrophoropsis aurantiaca TaxID=72124 RepID=A0ACB7ZW17_9AGAM|nr:hypothetical protein BJ138DRAFT_1118833 [Hygrophoropsis aurantiaca]